MMWDIMSISNDFNAMNFKLQEWHKLIRKYIRGKRSNTMFKVLVLHIVNSSSIPNLLYGSLSTARCDSWVHLGLTPDHCFLRTLTKIEERIWLSSCWFSLFFQIKISTSIWKINDNICPSLCLLILFLNHIHCDWIIKIILKCKNLFSSKILKKLASIIE